MLQYKMYPAGELAVLRQLLLSLACTKYKESYCSHPGRPRLRLRLRLRSRSRHTVLKFFKCLYLNSHSSQRHQIWNLGTLEGLLRFQENKPLGSCPWVGLGVRI